MNNNDMKLIQPTCYHNVALVETVPKYITIIQ